MFLKKSLAMSIPWIFGAKPVFVYLLIAVDWIKIIFQELKNNNLLDYYK